MTTYPLAPDRVISDLKEYDILISKPEVSKEARRARNTSGNPRRTFVIEHNHVSFTQKETFLNFFTDRRGRWASFDFINPVDSQTYSVRFDSDEVSIDKPLGSVENPRYVIRVTLREVL